MEKEKQEKEENLSVHTPVPALTMSSSSSSCSTSTTATTSGTTGFGVFTSKKMSETFLRTLECPVCLEIVVPPVISCTLGHIICSMCRPKLAKCGLCGSAFTSIRNYPIEAMLSLVETDCRHTSCQMKLMADKLMDHLHVCDYRPVACHETTAAAECKGVLINFEDYAKHLMDVHGKNYVDLTSEYPEFVVYDVSTTFHGSQLLGVMNYKSKTFFLKRDYVFQRHYAMCWVTVLAAEATARKYSFHLKIIDPRDPNRSMEWRIRAHSVHTPPELMKSSGDCAFISYDALLPFCERKYIPTPNGQLCEYKWSMIGKIGEAELPPPPAHSTNQVTPTASNNPQINPLNLCASSSSSNSSSSSSGASSSGGASTSSAAHSSNNHSNQSFAFVSPTVLLSSFPIAEGTSSTTSLVSPRFSNQPHTRQSVGSGFNFTFPPQSVFDPASAVFPVRLGPFPRH